MTVRKGNPLAGAFLSACVALAAGGGLPVHAQSVPLGTSIPNHATLRIGNSILADASVSVRVTSGISFQRYSASSAAQSPSLAASAGNTWVNGTWCQGSNRLQPAFGGNASGNLPALPATYPLETTTYYVVGEPLFIRVSDASRNLDPATVDELGITVTDPATQDSQSITIRETGVNTGEFVGFLNTGTGTVVANDCLLTVARGDQLTASYNNEVTDSAALVDPYGVVFDSTTGARLNGTRVRIVDALTGLPAQVFGDDGAVYPDTVLTGSTITVGAITYNFAPGEFRFPLVASGKQYKLLVDQLPPGYNVPTGQPDAHFASGNVPNGPYVVGTGSRQDAFLVPAGPPVHVDIPADIATSGLFVMKSAGASIAAIGDFVPYSVQVSNTTTATAFANVHVHDRLPPGFRYRPGSLKFDGVKAPDPAIGSDGRDLDISLGTLAAKAAIRVSYITEIAAGTRPGNATNMAWAVSGPATSNQSSAVVTVREDLMRSRALLAGRVMAAESCDADDLARSKAVANARIYLEDGRYVLTDTRGRWHFDDIRPGTHVVQLDKHGLPANTEIMACERHTRSAGNAQSQFVDVQGGTLWQVDFYLRKLRPLHYVVEPVQENVGLRLSSEIISQGTRFTLQVNNGTVDLDRLRLALALPKNLRYLDDSFSVNGETGAEGNAVLQQGGGDAVITLQKLAKNSAGNRISWDMALDAAAAAGVRPVRASLHAEVDGQPLELSTVENSVSVVQPEKVGRVIIFRPHFGSFSTTLSTADRKWLDDISADLADAGDIRLDVVGHTDDVRVVPRPGRAINDNYALSAARAQSVADYLRGKLKLPVERINVIGKGSDEPLVNDKTPKGRDTNRRVELKVFAAAQSEPPRLELQHSDSGEQKVSWTRWQARQAEVAAPALAKNAGDTAATTVPADAASAAPAAVTQTSAVINDEDSEQTGDLQDTAVGLLSLKDGEVIAQRVQALRVRMDSRLKGELAVDGRVVPEERLGFSKNEGKTTLMSFIGVDFGEPGPHVLTLVAKDPFGNVRLNQKMTVTVAGEITRLRAVTGPENIADGRSPVQLRIELVDGSGRVVPAAVDLRLVSGELRPLVTGDVQRSVADSAGKVPVGADGLIKFAPVTRSGLYTIELAYNQTLEKIPVYVRPEKRDWILVGLAEGSVMEKKLSGNMQNLSDAGVKDDLLQDGRVAFFAKGQVRGDWLLTMAYDTDRERAMAFGGAIDPTRYYTLYADAADPRYDAASKKKLYLRIEKDAFYALFGDFDTGMTVTELGRYSRTLTGLKSEYHDSRFDLNVFAADTSQAFQRDEQRGNGTSGLYKLRGKNILAGSDKIRLEVRDRYKTDVILNSQQLSRYADYSIDYDRGEIFFKAPVPSQDEHFNPVWIVAEYEQEVGSGEAVNAGGRGAVKFLNGRALVGASLVQEDAGLNKGSLQGLDAEYRLSVADVLRAEVARSSNDDITLGNASGTASLLEWKRDSQKLKSRVYYREEASGFGLGQQSASEDGTRKMGVEGRYQLRHDIFFTADVFHQEMVDTGATREMADLRGEYQHDAYALSAGFRFANESLTTGDSSTQQLALGGRYNLFKDVVKLRANAEIGVQQSEAQDFPDRLLVGADYQVLRNVTLTAEEEWAWSALRSTQTSRAGVKYQPWKGATMSTNLDKVTTESGDRLRAGLGLGQRLALTPEWNMDLGYDQASTLKDNTTSSFNPAQPAAFGPATTSDFWAAYVGANYQSGDLKGVSRIERRDGTDAKQWNIVGGAYRELNPQIAIASGLTATFADESSGDVDDRALLRGSLAWRPDRERWMLLEQLDYGMDRKETAAAASTLTSTSNVGHRLVNNLNTSKRWEDDQLSFQYGAKYVFATVDSTRVSGYTDLLGAEWRHDLNERWDVGMRSSVLHSWGPGTMDYSYGISVGVTPMPNAWVSLGFNFQGFKDGDFSGAEYSAKGLYLKMRLKVDQDSLKQIWNDTRGAFH